MKYKLKRFFELFRPEYTFEFSDELPETVTKRTIYIVGNKHEPWLLAFICPCGCKSVIQLNLIKDKRLPGWRFVIKKNKLSIFPSVRRIVGCKSHFLIRKSKVNWI